MSSAEFYNHTTYPANGAFGSSSALRSELELIKAGFGKLPDLAGNGGNLVAITAGGTALQAITTTGTGSGVRATSPTLVTPLLGTPTSGTLTNCIGLPVASGLSGLAAGIATFLATPSSANLSAAVTDETGSGALVFGTSPTIATPVLNGLVTGTSVASVNTALTLVARDISGNFAAGTITAALAGNASTAAALQTARAINGVNFDGTAPITVTAAAGTLTGATLAAGVTASSLTSVGTLGTLTVSGATATGPLTVNGSLTAGGNITATNATFIGNNTYMVSTGVYGWGPAGATANYIIGDTTANTITVHAASVDRAVFSSAGLAVTGVVTATGSITSTGAVAVVTAASSTLDINGSQGRVIVRGVNTVTVGVLAINLTASDGTLAATPAIFSSTGVAVYGGLSVTGSAGILVSYSSSVALFRGNAAGIVTYLDVGNVNFRDSDGVGSGSARFNGTVGINGKTPVASVAAPAAAGATYTATEQTLLNDIRTRLINFGIYT